MAIPRPPMLAFTRDLTHAHDSGHPGWTLCGLSTANMNHAPFETYGIPEARCQTCAQRLYSKEET